MLIVDRVAGWLSESAAVRDAGTSRSQRPVCDACIVIMGAGRHLERLDLGPDDTTELQRAVAAANRCLQHAWSHALIVLAEAAAAEPLTHSERENVLRASQAAAAGNTIKDLANCLAGFGGLTEQRRQQLLAYARGFAAAAARAPHGDSAPPDAAAPHSEIVDFALHTSDAASPAMQAHLESAPSGRDARACSKTMLDLADRFGVDIGAEPQPNPDPAAGLLTLRR